MALKQVSKQGVFKEIERHPRFSLHMLSSISSRLYGLVHDVQGYTLRNGMRRLIDYLLTDVALTSTTALTVTLPASKATIASRLSLMPEYFSRVLHELEFHHLIKIDKRDILIADIQKLANYGSC